MTNNFEALYKRYTTPQDKERLMSMEKEYRVCSLFMDIKDADAIKIMEEHCKASVQSILSKLLSYDDMTEKERAELNAQRKVYEWFLTIFPNREAQLKNIEEFIKTKTYG